VALSGACPNPDEPQDLTAVPPGAPEGGEHPRAGSDALDEEMDGLVRLALPPTILASRQE